MLNTYRKLLRSELSHWIVGKNSSKLQLLNMLVERCWLFWFYLVFPRKYKSMDAGFHPRKNPANSIFNRKVKNTNSNGVSTKVAKLIVISRLLAEADLVNGMLLCNRWLRRNINIYNNVIRFIKKTELRSTSRAMRVGKKQINYERIY